jgi:hypothetical protein
MQKHLKPIISIHLAHDFPTLIPIFARLPLRLLHGPTPSWRKSSQLIGRLRKQVKASRGLAGSTVRGEETHTKTFYTGEGFS